MTHTQPQNLEFKIFRKIYIEENKGIDSVKIEESVESLQAFEMNLRQLNNEEEKRKIIVLNNYEVCEVVEVS